MQQESNYNNHEIIWSPEKVKRIWDYYSKNLSSKEYLSYHSGNYIIDYIDNYIEFKKVRSILDFGCDPGFLIEHLLKILEKGTVFGLDFSREAVEIVNKRFNKHKGFGKAV